MKMRQRRRAIAHSPRRKSRARVTTLRQMIRDKLERARNQRCHVSDFLPLTLHLPVFKVSPDFGVIAIDSACA